VIILRFVQRRMRCELTWLNSIYRAFSRDLLRAMMRAKTIVEEGAPKVATECQRTRMRSPGLRGCVRSRSHASAKAPTPVHVCTPPDADGEPPTLTILAANHSHIVFHRDLTRDAGAAQVLLYPPRNLDLTFNLWKRPIFQGLVLAER
jgi:hypothetical protein